MEKTTFEEILRGGQIWPISYLALYETLNMPTPGTSETARKRLICIIHNTPINLDNVKITQNTL